jgi:aspartate/methionine/tyrosine aminotransferase
MQLELNPMVRKIRPSVMFRFMQKAKEMQRQGVEIIHLEMGEPEFGPPKGAIEAAKDAMDKGYNVITPIPGMIELREAIAEDLEIEYGISVNPSEEIAVVPGAKFGIFTTIASTILPGDEVLCLSPFFPPYREIVEMLGGRFIPVPFLEGRNCKLSVRNFEEKITPRTRFLILNYPHNPTGWVPTDTEISLLLDVVKRKDLIVVSDEVYEKIIFDGLKHRPFFGFQNLKEQLVLVNSFSKRFAMTGWRIGYCVGPRNLIEGIIRIQQNTTTCANSVVQRAVVVALKEEKPFPAMLSRAYGDRKDLIIKRLQGIPGLNPIAPKGGLFIFVSISKLSVSSMQFAEKLLEEEHIAIAPGVAFGEDWDQYIRVSMTEDSEKIAVALDRLERFVKKLH